MEVKPVSQVGGHHADRVDPRAFLSPCGHPLGAYFVDSADLEEDN
jgi:hypothetical protein